MCLVTECFVSVQHGRPAVCLINMLFRMYMLWCVCVCIYLVRYLVRYVHVHGTMAGISISLHMYVYMSEFIVMSLLFMGV